MFQLETRPVLDNGVMVIVKYSSLFYCPTTGKREKQLQNAERICKCEDKLHLCFQFNFERTLYACSVKMFGTDYIHCFSQVENENNFSLPLW